MLVALVLVQVTGVEWIDPAVALVVAAAIVARGRADPLAHLARAGGRGAAAGVRAGRRAGGDRGARASDEVTGFHKLRARRAGSRRYIDLHVQFAEGTTLRRAHEVTHELQREIRDRVRGADVLIHLEPERDGSRPPREAGA